MKVVIFGATGGTGRFLVRGALQRGHEVTAFARDGTKVETLDGIRIAAGDAENASAVRAAIAGQDAVMFALGPRTIAANPLLPRASTNVVEAMRQSGVQRLIVLGAAGSLRDSSKHHSIVTRLGFAVMKATLLHYPMRMQAALQAIVEASALDYTIALPPRLLDEPRIGRYRVALDALPPNGLLLNRADLADFMLDCLDQALYIRQTPYVAH